MSNLSRAFNRKKLHSVRKCFHKIERRLRQARLDYPNSEQEANAAVVRVMSHKDLKIVSHDAEAFQELLQKNGKHIIELVQSALLERAILGSVETRPEFDRVTPGPVNVHELPKI